MKQTLILFSAFVGIITAVMNLLMDILSDKILLCKCVDDFDPVEKKGIIKDTADARVADNLSGSDMDLSVVFSSEIDNPVDVVLVKCTKECVIRDDFVSSSTRAATKVRDIWNESSNLLENGFCDNHFAPELLMLNSGMLKLALNTLRVSPSVIAKSNNDFFEFMYCIKQQRRKFKDDFMLLKLFDREWGISEENGAFTYHSPGSCNGCMFYLTEARVDTLIHKEHAHVKALTKQKIEMMSELHRSATYKCWCGIHILHLFIVDLIGRHNAAAIVFAEKCQQEYVLCNYPINILL